MFENLSRTAVREDGNDTQVCILMKIIILSGFLGSGKTTVLLKIAQKLIEQQEKVVVIENEVGDVGIDGSYLENQGLQVQELFGGCICCTLTVGLVEAIEKLQSNYSPDVILIEATGMARPTDLAETIKKYSQVKNLKIITVVDAERYDLLRNGLAPLFEAQVEPADTILLNKIDRITHTELEKLSAEIKLLNSFADIFSLSLEKTKELANILRRVYE